MTIRLGITSYNGEKYTINLSINEFSCIRWMLIWLSCCHVISCMKDHQLDIDAFVLDCYKKEWYEACYAPILYPINGQTLWTKFFFINLLPPPIKRQPGRPKKKRIREAREMVKPDSQLKRVIFGIKCSRFHKDGHNKAICKLPIPQATPNQSGPTNFAPSTQAAEASPN